MAYQRPGTRQVNVGNGRLSIGETRVIAGKGPSQGRSGGSNVLMASPDQVGLNAGQSAREISGFLRDVYESGVVQDVGKSMVVANANRQIGELVSSQPDIGAQYRAATPDQRNQLRGLSGYAQDQFIRNQAITAKGSYMGGMTAATLGDSTLNTVDPASPQWQQRYAEIQVEQRKLSGLTNLPAGVVGAMGGEFALVEAGIKGKLHTQYVQNRGKMMTAKAVGALAEEIGQATQLVDWENGTGQLETAEAMAAKLMADRDALAEKIKSDMVEGSYTYQESLSNQLTATQKAINSAIVDENYEQATSILARLEHLSKLKIAVGPDGLNFWDQRATVGGRQMSVEAFIVSWEDKLHKGKTRDADRRATIKMDDVVKGLSSGEPAQIDNAIVQGRQIILNIKDPVERQKAIQILQQNMNYSKVPTPRQMKNANRALIDAINPNVPLGERQEAILRLGDSGALTPGQEMSLLGNAGRPTEYQKAIVSSLGTAKALGNVDIALNDVIASEPGQPADAKAHRDAVLQELQAGAYDKTMTWLDSNPGASQKEIDEQFGINLDATRDELIKLNGGPGKNRIQDKPINIEVGKLVLIDTDGKLDYMSFSEEFRDLAERNGVRKNYESTATFAKQLMLGAKRNNGDPVYGKDMAEVQRWWLKNVVKKDPANEVQRFESGRSPGSFSPTRLPDPANSSKDGDKKGDGDQASAVEQVKGAALNALGTIANVALGASPANAQEVAFAIENEQTLDELAALWANPRAKPTLQTPFLPQVAASSVTVPVELSIKSDKHPFFIAIGISEGTRTANGGYTQAYYGHTDPGNGARNVGTVSGQQGGSPQQSDRRWMGKLTQTQMRAAQLFRMFGLSPGTQGWNRLMFNALDLNVQAPAAVSSFLVQIPKIVQQGLTVESIAKARADSFYNPQTGQLEAGGFGNSYNRLFSDQRSRAGVWDYRRRL